VSAWLVHAFTASGVVLAYLAIEAIVAGAVRDAFIYLAIATGVDSVDGVLARLARVKERTPQFDGALLDNIIDYLTFTLVPVFLLRQQRLLPDDPAGVAIAVAVLLSSAYGFCRTDAKTTDHFFTGFPSYWNIVALYMVGLGTSPTTNAIALIIFVALVFVPIGYVYPSRTPKWQALSVGLGLTWGAAMALVIWTLPSPPAWLVWGSLLYPVYYGALSLYLHARRGRGRHVAD
jgi:phosphatidylcholine synthase